LLGAALSLVIDVAAAQVASDNELYAAYCLGVLQDVQQGQRKWYLEAAELMKPSPDEENEEFRKDMRRAMQEDAKDLNQKLSRFRTYLGVRGFRTGGGRDQQAYTGLQVALRRGRSDTQQCSQYSEKNCAPRCTLERVGLDGISKCADQCRTESAACQSSKRCLKADTLPF
jgi:hypothetical protein